MAVITAPDLLDGLNPEQRAAVTHEGGPLLVLAGAGTGKTRTLTARVAWLRENGVPAQRILLLTFTRRAADDMLARARDGLCRPGRAGAADADRVVGGTFHAIAHRVIRAHAEAFSLPPAFSVIDPADAADVMDTMREAHGLIGSERRAPRAMVCADIYTRCVNTATPLAEVITASFPWCAAFAEQLGALFDDYTRYKRRHGLVDFDDLLLLWRAALADESAGPALRGQFDAVLVDEYQDVNAVQADIVTLLCPSGGGLTCVGDDAQAIYAFRGADPAHLRVLPARFPAMTIVRLERNYRSRPHVLALASQVRPQWDGLELTLTAERDGDGAARPVLLRCHDEAAQAREVCARILAEHEAGTELREQAVLVRAVQHSYLLEAELAARGIPFVKYGGLRFTEAAHVKDFLAAARLAANPADEPAWFRLLRLHEGVGPALARRLITVLRLADPQPFQHWPEAVAVLPKRCAAPVHATIGAVIEASRLATTAERASAILAAVAGPLRARYPDAAARLADLERLADAAAARPTLHDALVELALDPPMSGSDLAGSPRFDNDYLIISTVHSAKGLEWPVVHLPQLVDGAVPSDMALTGPDGLAEEHRLFYVAVSRARDRIYLYAPLRLHHHRCASDDRHGYGQLSRFLDDRALACCEMVDAEPYRVGQPRVAASVRLTAAVDGCLADLWRQG